MKRSSKTWMRYEATVHLITKVIINSLEIVNKLKRNIQTCISTVLFYTGVSHRLIKYHAIYLFSIINCHI